MAQFATEIRMQLTCPACFSRFSIEAALADADGRQLMQLLATQPAPLPLLVVSYLSLWRSKNRALAWPRALKLATEALSLAPVEVLAPALEQTVNTLRNKQAEGCWKPLSSHGYLKRVLEDQPAVVPGQNRVMPVAPRVFAKTSATNAGITALQARKNHV